MAISTYKIDFAFDGSQIQTRGEVGQISTEPVEVVVVVGEAGGGGWGLLDKVLYGEALPGSQTT